MVRVRLRGMRSFRIPTNPLPPALPGLDVTVSRLETIRPDMPVPLAGGGNAMLYLEELEGEAEVVMQHRSRRCGGPA